MATARSYFIGLWDPETWAENRRKARFTFTGFDVNLRNKSEIRPGDLFLCWVTGGSGCVGVMEVAGEAYVVDHEDPPTFQRGLYPLRYPVRLLRRVPLTSGVTFSEIRNHTEDPTGWVGIVRNNGNAVPPADAEWIIDKLGERPPLPSDADEPEGIGRRSRRGAVISAPTVSEVPVEEQWTEQPYVVARSEAYEATREEQQLVVSLKAHLERQGHSVCRLRIVPPGESPLFTDLFDEKTRVLIEAKASVEREAIRMAIGQLADYGRFVEGEHRRAVLLPEPPREDLKNLLASEQVEVIWPVGTAFADSTGGELV